MAQRFAFHRGSVALDFVGTLGWRSSRGEERLPDSAALEAWLREAGLLAERGRATADDVAAARELRETIARVLIAIHGGATPARADVAAINETARGAALAMPALDPRTLDLIWTSSDPIHAALGRVAADAIEVIATRRDRLVRCELDGCGALLLSASRGAPRRWCSMETCGNVAKVAAHRARVRATAGAPPAHPQSTLA